MTGTRDALSGRRVLVLRVGDTAEPLVSELSSLGAACVVVSVGTVVDRPDDEVRRDVGDLARFAWVAVTSANAARRLDLWSSAWPGGVRIAVVGPSTADAVAATGLACTLTAAGGTARDLAEHLEEGPVLFLCAAGARDDLPRTLEAKGVVVDRVVAYDVVVRVPDPAEVAGIAGADVLVAMSPMGADAVAACGRDPGADHRPRLVAIGPTTAGRASDLGLAVDEVASERSTEGIVAAVLRALDGPPPRASKEIPE